MTELENYFFAQGCTKAEVVVCMHLMTGKSNKEIADDLFRSEKSVKFHCTSIYRKLHVTSRPEFMAKHWEIYFSMAMQDKDRKLIPKLHQAKGLGLPAGTAQ